MKEWVLNHRQDLIGAIAYFGFLPFFANEISGFSVEEMTPAELWFTDREGPWEWKGPVISEGNCVYGKVFGKKSVFVSNRWYPDFANVRRDGYDFDARFEDGLADHREKYLYELIASRHSILSKDAKLIGGYVKPKQTGKDDWKPRTGFDSTITKLQMQGYVIISDFEYERSKTGEPYGWGIARYALPEVYLGASFRKRVYKRKPEQSADRIRKHLRTVLPQADEVSLERLITGKNRLNACL